MNDNKVLIAGGVIAVALVCLAGALLYMGRPDVNVSLGEKPVTVTVDGKPVTLNVEGDEGDVSYGSEDQTFGANADEVSNWTSGAFSDDLYVGDDLTVMGSVIADSLSVTGTITNLAGYGALNIYAVSSTFAAATTTLCAIQNTSIVPRTVLDIGVVTNASGYNGSPAFIAGTSSNPGVTSTTPLLNAAVTLSSTVPQISTTATVQTVYGTWLPSQYLVFKTSTTTNGGGTCRAAYY